MYSVGYYWLGVIVLTWLGASIVVSGSAFAFVGKGERHKGILLAKGLQRVTERERERVRAREAVNTYM